MNKVLLLCIFVIIYCSIVESMPSSSSSERKRDLVVLKAEDGRVLVAVGNGKHHKKGHKIRDESLEVAKNDDGEIVLVKNDEEIEIDRDSHRKGWFLVFHFSGSDLNKSSYLKFHRWKN